MDEPLTVRIGPGFPLDRDFKVRVSVEHANDLAKALRDAGYKADPSMEHSATVELSIFLVSFAQAGGLDGLANVLAAFFSRHDNKRFVVRGPNNAEIEADGYSARDVRRLLGTAVEWVDAQDQVWQRNLDASTTHEASEIEPTDEEAAPD